MDENNITVSTKKQRPKMSLTDIIVYPIVYLLTFSLISKLVDDIDIGVSFPLIYIGFFIAANIYIAAKRSVNFKRAAFTATAIFLLLLSVTLHGFRDQFVITFLLVILLSGVYCVKLTERDKGIDGTYLFIFEIIRSEFLVPVKNIFLPLLSLGTIKFGKTVAGKKKFGKIFGVLFGAALAVPVLMVVFPLLIESDIAFESLTEEFADSFISMIDRAFNKVFGEDMFWLLPAAIFAPYIFSVMFTFRHSVDEKSKMQENFNRFQFVPSNVFLGFLGAITFIYAVYLLSQLGYFFNGFLGKLPEKMTVSLYARKGFYEMALVALINLLLIGFTVIFSKRSEEKISKTVKGFDIFLCIFTMILVVSSISKILLYIDVFGLTHKRVYVFIIDIILFVSFLCVLTALFKKDFPYMKVIFSFGVLAMAFVLIVGVDDTIYKYNTEMYIGGKLETVDTDYSYSYITSIEYAHKLMKSENEELKLEASKKTAELFVDYITSYRSYTFYENIDELKKIGMPEYSFTDLDTFRAERYIEQYFDELMKIAEEYFKLVAEEYGIYEYSE